MRGEGPVPILRFFRRFPLETFLAALVTILFADYLFSDKLLYGSDSIPGGLFFRGLLVEFVKEFHELPRWNPFILGGLPFLDATHGDTFFPSSLLQFVMPVYRGLGHKLVLHIFLAGAFMAFYLRSLELHPRAVAFGALAYMLSPVFVSYLYAGQDGKMYVTSLFPLVLGLLERAMGSARPRLFLALGFAIGLTILSAQIQMAYHAMWFAGALFVLRLFLPRPSAEARPGRLRVAFLFGGSVALGLLVAAIQLLPAVAYVKHPAQFSVRSDRTDYEHASSWSLHPEEIASMVVPEFCNSPGGYWGRNFFKSNSDYVGIFTVFLAGLAIARRRDSTRLFLAGLALFAILYSLGAHTPLHRLFYHVVPQVKLFRAPPLVMFGAAFGLCALAAHALHDLEHEEKRGAKKSPASGILVWGMGAAALILLAGFSAHSMNELWNDFVLPGIEELKVREQLENLPAFRRGSFVAALVLASGALLVHARVRGRLSPRVLFVALMGLTVFDLWRVDARFKLVIDPERFTVADPVLAPLELESKREKFRVMPTLRHYAGNEMGYFGIESTLGFHDNELAWYRELRSAPESKAFLAANVNGYPFLRMLNVKYVLHDTPEYPNPLELEGYLPRFWVVEDWKLVEARSEIPGLLLEPGFDPAQTVLLEEDPGLARPPLSESGPPRGAVRAYAYRGNKIQVEMENERPCLLVHSENWFPYWHVFEGEKELPLLRANGTIRAVPLAPGKHELEFRFRSVPFEAGKWITISTLLVATLAFVGSAIRTSRFDL